jgi:hypothetical protein
LVDLPAFFHAEESEEERFKASWYADNEQDRKIKAKLVLSYVGLSGSFLVFLWTIFAFGSSFLQSEFWNKFLDFYS